MSLRSPFRRLKAAETGTVAATVMSPLILSMLLRAMTLSLAVSCSTIFFGSFAAAGQDSVLPWSPFFSRDASLLLTPRPSLLLLSPGRHTSSFCAGADADTSLHLPSWPPPSRRRGERSCSMWTGSCCAERAA